jgi:hypothetical protein
MEAVMNQLVTHIEDAPKSGIHRALDDQFTEIFGVDENDSIIKSVTDITDAMFGGAKPQRMTREDKLAAATYHMKQANSLLADLKYQYEDRRGNLDEAHRMSGEILLNISGHESDIKGDAE